MTNLPPAAHEPRLLSISAMAIHLSWLFISGASRSDLPWFEVLRAWAMSDGTGISSNCSCCAEMCPLYQRCRTRLAGLGEGEKE